MNLHLTVNTKLLDSISIDQQKRKDKEYMESMQALLKLRNKEVLRELRAEISFYLDPDYVEIQGAGAML